MYNLQNTDNISRSPKRLPALQVIQTNGTENFGRSSESGKKDNGRFPFNPDFQSEFYGKNEWNSVFKDFVNRGQPREVYPNFRKFFFPEGSFPFTLLSEFLEFSVEWFAFNFRNFWKLFPAIPVPFTPVFKFLKVLVEWKAPNSSKVLPFVGKTENIIPG